VAASRRITIILHRLRYGARKIMLSDPKAYRFRPVSLADLPRLRAWLQTPEVVRWWGDPAEQLELIREDLKDPRMVTCIVSFGGRPFAYVQDYAVHNWPQSHFKPHHTPCRLWPVAATPQGDRMHFRLGQAARHPAQDQAPRRCPRWCRVPDEPHRL
jgi:hypothetical protein